MAPCGMSCQRLRLGLCPALPCPQQSIMMSPEQTTHSVTIQPAIMPFMPWKVFAPLPPPCLGAFSCWRRLAPRAAISLWRLLTPAARMSFCCRNTITDMEWLAHRLQSVVSRDGYALVVLSEALPSIDELKEEIPNRTGIRLRYTALGHAQRGADASHRDRCLARDMSWLAWQALKQDARGRHSPVKKTARFLCTKAHFQPAKSRRQTPTSTAISMVCDTECCRPVPTRPPRSWQTSATRAKTLAALS